MSWIKEIQGCWKSVLLLALFSTNAKSQTTSTVDRATRFTSRPTSVTSHDRYRSSRARLAPQGSSSLHRRRQNLLANARASAVQDCRSTACVILVPLPVKLVEFYGVRLSSSEVQLRWKTAEEINNERFELERTLNPALGFEVVGTVRGKNNSTQSTSYQWIDPNDAEQYTYYRLKQVDGDGSVTYSRIISVKGYANMFSVVPYPNPATPDLLKFSIYGHKPGEPVHVLIYDVKGQMVSQKTFDILPDDKQISVPGMEHKRGSFIVKIKSGMQESSAHFVLVN
jgi:hypothetical protein